MKRLVTLLLVTALLAIMIPSLFACTPRERVLKILNWEDYIGEDVIEDFKQYYYEMTGEKIKVLYDATETNENMLSVIAVGQSDYDVICPSDYMIEKMVKENLLLEINQNLGNDINGNPITNYMELASDFTTGRDFDPTGKYSVGYMWGTMGILYNTKHITNPDDVKSWSALWNSAYTGKILMKDSVRDSFLVASIYAHKAELDAARATMTPEEYAAEVTRVINDTTTQGITITKNALINQKPYLRGFEVDTGKQDMIDATAWLSLQWAGDAVYSISENSDLAYVIPEEGSNLFFDGWVIPKYAGNKRAAELFINFMSKPSTAIANMDYIGYTSVISSQEIIDYLNDTYSEYPAIDLSYFFGDAGTSVKADPNMYPTQDVIYRLGVMRDFGDAESDIASMWNLVKSS